MCFRIPLPAPFLKQLFARFQHCWKAARPCYRTPDIRHRSCLGRKGVLPKIEWVAPSMIGQCIFLAWHPQVCNRQTVLVSLESTGLYQRNCASLIFMHCVVLEIHLFFRLHTGLVIQETNFWSTWIRNNRISRTTQRIKVRLAPLCW